MAAELAPNVRAAYTWLTIHPSFNGEEISASQREQMRRLFRVGPADLAAIQSIIESSFHIARGISEGDGGVMKAGREKKRAGFEGKPVTKDSALTAVAAEVQSPSDDRTKVLEFLRTVPGLDQKQQKELEQTIRAMYADPTRTPKVTITGSGDGPRTLLIERADISKAKANQFSPGIAKASEDIAKRSMDKTGWKMNGEYVDNRLGLSAKAAKVEDLGSLAATGMSTAMARSMRAHLNQTSLALAIKIDVPGKDGTWPENGKILKIVDKDFTPEGTKPLALVSTQLRWQSRLGVPATVAQDVIVAGRKPYSMFCELGSGMEGVLYLNR